MRPEFYRFCLSQNCFILFNLLKNDRQPFSRKQILHDSRHTSLDITLVLELSFLAENLRKKIKTIFLYAADLHVSLAKLTQPFAEAAVKNGD